MPALKRNPDGTPHVHCFVQAFINFRKRDPDKYRCDHPDCTTVMWRKDLRGKRALCAVCRVNEIILDAENLTRANPRCVWCSGSKRDQKIREMQSGLDELFKDSELNEISEEDSNAKTN